MNDINEKIQNIFKEFKEVDKQVEATSDNQDFIYVNTKLRAHKNNKTNEFNFCGSKYSKGCFGGSSSSAFDNFDTTAKTKSQTFRCKKSKEKSKEKSRSKSNERIYKYYNEFYEYKLNKDKEPETEENKICKRFIRIQ